MNVYDMKVTDIDGSEVLLSEYAGKVLLIVNTATACGFTPQLESLQQLYSEYEDRGLEILAFPCNQFRNQAPEESMEIDSFCRLNYGVSFRTFAKIDVNGDDASELYVYLKEADAERRKQSASLMNRLKGIIGDDIAWNFTKFLVDREGHLVMRYAPSTSPRKIAPDIEKLL